MHTHPFNDPFTWSSLVMHTHPFNDPFTWSSLQFMHTHPFNDPFTWSSLAPLLCTPTHLMIPSHGVV